MTSPSLRPLVWLADELHDIAIRLDKAYGHLPSWAFPGPPTSITDRLRVISSRLAEASPPADEVEASRSLTAPIEEWASAETMRRAFLERSSGYGKGLRDEGSPGENAAAKEAFRNFAKGYQAARSSLPDRPTDVEALMQAAHEFGKVVYGEAWKSDQNRQRIATGKLRDLFASFAARPPVADTDGVAATTGAGGAMEALTELVKFHDALARLDVLNDTPSRLVDNEEYARLLDIKRKGPKKLMDRARALTQSPATNKEDR